MTTVTPYKGLGGVCPTVRAKLCNNSKQNSLPVVRVLGHASTSLRVADEVCEEGGFRKRMLLPLHFAQDILAFLISMGKLLSQDVSNFQNSTSAHITYIHQVHVSTERLDVHVARPQCVCTKVLRFYPVQGLLLPSTPCLCHVQASD